eukprot:scaffold4368_cov180-Ochromonas_danica.AAC.12
MISKRFFLQSTNHVEALSLLDKLKQELTPSFSLPSNFQHYLEIVYGEDSAGNCWAKRSLVSAPASIYPARITLPHDS